MGKTAMRISKTNNKFPQQNKNSAPFFCRYCRTISFTERVNNKNDNFFSLSSVNLEMVHG